MSQRTISTPTPISTLLFPVHPRVVELLGVRGARIRARLRAPHALPCHPPPARGRSRRAPRSREDRQPAAPREAGGKGSGGGTPAAATPRRPCPGPGPRPPGPSSGAAGPPAPPLLASLEPRGLLDFFFSAVLGDFAPGRPGGRGGATPRSGRPPGPGEAAARPSSLREAPPGWGPKSPFKSSNVQLDLAFALVEQLQGGTSPRRRRSPREKRLVVPRPFRRPHDPALENPKSKIQKSQSLP